MSAPVRVVAIVGPTAVGKSALALALAEGIGGVIISADSRQIYRGLDIGTAKPTREERARVPHYLLDVADPDERFDADRFRTLAAAAAQASVAAGRPIVVCGGTGLYVRALLSGLFAGPAAVPELRAALYARERSEGGGTLHRELARVDPTSAARLHVNDLVRIVRALEVRQVTGRPISVWQAEHRFADATFEPLVLGCLRPREELAGRIATRCRAMLDAGLLGEIEALRAAGHGDAPALASVGYCEMGDYLRGVLDYEAAFEAFARATRRLAKRQLTWWRSDPSLTWYHPDRDGAALLARAAAWLVPACPSPISTSSSPSPR